MKNITITVPNNATNGDVIKELLFPYFIGINKEQNLVCVYDTEEQYEKDNAIEIHDLNWWNAEYIREED